tara:strand:+ start:575 stop:1420 length:846 start_codon:yes stop_codon:yes gene_type:complete
MFYLLGITILMSLAIYVGTAFYISNRAGYDRRQENVELFKKEKENLKLNKSLPQESLSLLVDEREQILLQDVPKERDLIVLTKKDSLIRPIIFSFFSFLSICGIYFQPLSMGSLKDLQTYQSINGFFEANKDEREIKRSKIVEDLDSFLKRKESTASELYFLSLKFKDIQEFSLNSRLLKQLIREYSDEIPSDIYSEYAQSLFFQEGMKFSPLVIEALNQALSKSSENPIALTLKGIQYFQEGDNILAKSTWEKAIEKTVNEEEKRSIKSAIDTIDAMKNQ